MDPNSKSFKDLQAKWYSKLKDEGFDDIEHDEYHLKVWSSQFFKVRHNATLFQAKEEYYRLAGKFLYDYKFTSPVDRMIWELHSEGHSIRKIVAELKKARHKAYRRHVHEKLQGMFKAMMELYGTD